MQITNMVQSWLQKKYQKRMESCFHLLLEVFQWYHFIPFFFFGRHIKNYLLCPLIEKENIFDILDKIKITIFNILGNSCKCHFEGLQ